MNRPFWIVIFLFPIVCMSCKKEHLYDEREIFIGSWNWAYSRGLPRCATATNDTVFSSQYPNQYSIEISKKEKIFLMENQEVIAEDQVRISTFDGGPSANDGYSFTFYPDETQTVLVSGAIFQDSLFIFSYWPGDFVESLCQSYENVFVRVD